ncbi:MAG: glycosyltransferase [Candidatus Bathyarchaeia archaeon]
MENVTISVIVCAHNEESYIGKCLSALRNALQGLPNKVIVVADRCNDRTVEIARHYSAKIIEKNWKVWRNSYSESLQVGYLNADGKYIGIVDADVVVSPNFFKDLIPLIRGEIVSVSAQVMTYPDTFLNKLMNAWERTYYFAPLGKAPYGAVRIILKRALDEIGGFRDVPTPDTDIDIRFARKGYRSIESKKVKAYHIRHITIKKIIDGQINCGRGRYALGIGLARTIGHSIVRFRPLVVYGWFLERQISNLKNKSSQI